MNAICKLQQLRGRFGIVLDSTQELVRLRNRVLEAVDRIAGDFILVHPKISSRIAYLTGRHVPARSCSSRLPTVDISAFQLRKLSEEVAYVCIEEAESIGQFVEALQCLLIALEENSFPRLADLHEAVAQAMRDSPTLNLRLHRRSGKATILPASAALLDEQVVSDVLDWLSEHPQVAKQFRTALELYVTGDKSKHRNVLDNLRHAMEQLLRVLLRNRVRLERQSRPLTEWLRQRGVDAANIRMIATMLDRYTQFQNENVKHGDKFTPAEVELHLYLTGSIIRFLLQVRKASGDTINA